GLADNIVPPAFEITFDRRLMPGGAYAQADKELDAILKRAEQVFGVRTEAVGHTSTGGATATNLPNPVVVEAVRACKAHSVPESGPIGFMGGRDLVHFATAGTRGVILGPG